MGYRNVFVQSGAKISVRNNQLIIATDEAHSVPIEDISVILCESTQITLSSAALAALAENGACTLICNSKHLPCAAVLPFCTHSRAFEVYQKQASLTAPQKKRLWAQVVRAKILNQAECLRLCGKQDGFTALNGLAKQVTSGDLSNVEATAANRYFKELFGNDFTRGCEIDTRNAALNYGYAIFRGVLARHIAGYGFLPMHGLHHCSGLNAFNLADDLMEPFRPMVDLFTAANVSADSIFTGSLKHSLLNLLGCNVLVNGKQYAASYASELLVQSLSAFCTGNKSSLSLPFLTELTQHMYE